MKKYFSSVIIMTTFMLIGGLFVFVGQARSQTLADNLAGRILLQVEQKGEAWYIDPSSKERYYLGRPADAFQVMRELGLGISEADYDRFKDDVPTRLRGRIMLRVMNHGEAYYADPINNRFLYLARPADAYRIMRENGLGITNQNLERIRASFGSAPLPDAPIQSRFQNKLVYQYGEVADVEGMRKDCASRQGNFNTCGNICSPTAENCATLCAYTCERQGQVVGGDRDQHGCIPSAGYSWCEPKNKCLRIWEESCYVNTTQELRYRLAEKYNKNVSNVNVNVQKEVEGFAYGSVKYGQGGPGEGGMFLARKVGNAWELVFDGNGSVDCAQLRQQYSFPDSILVPNFCD